MEVLSAAVPDMVRSDHFRASSSWSGDPHFHGSNVTWAFMATRAEAAPITAVPDPDNSHSRVSFASEQSTGLSASKANAGCCLVGEGSPHLLTLAQCCNLSQASFYSHRAVC